MGNNSVRAVTGREEQTVWKCSAEARQRLGARCTCRFVLARKALKQRACTANDGDALTRTEAAARREESYCLHRPQRKKVSTYYFLEPFRFTQTKLPLESKRK